MHWQLKPVGWMPWEVFHPSRSRCSQRLNRLAKRINVRSNLKYKSKTRACDSAVSNFIPVGTLLYLSGDFLRCTDARPFLSNHISRRIFHPRKSRKNCRFARERYFIVQYLSLGGRCTGRSYVTMGMRLHNLLTIFPKGALKNPPSPGRLIPEL